jgi:hypothetical protein
MPISFAAARTPIDPRFSMISAPSVSNDGLRFVITFRQCLFQK